MNRYETPLIRRLSVVQKVHTHSEVAEGGLIVPTEFPRTALTPQESFSAGLKPRKGP